jgi:DNA polymerase-3 subunit delta
MAGYVSPAMLTPAQLLKEINAGTFRSAYYFFGAEDSRIIEATKYLARQFLGEAGLGINYVKINGRKTSASDLIAELSSLPMLGERQVFSISEFQSYKPKEVQRILAMLEPPDPNRVVIFSSPSPRTPKKKSAFLNTVQKATAAVEFDKLSASEVAGQVQGKLQKAGVEIERDALKVLIDLLAGNLGAVVAEVDKLVNYKGRGETITVDDVRTVAAGYEVIDIFALADEIVEREPARVLKMLEKLIDEGNSPVTICTLLSSHFLRLYLIRGGQGLTGRFAWLERKLRPQANRFDLARLEQILVDLADTEFRLRGGDIPPRTQLEMLVVGLVADSKIAHG